MSAGQQAGFLKVESHEFSYPYEWTTDTILGNLYSSNLKRMLADERRGFEAELRYLLLSHEPGGRFEEVMDFGYTLATKPG